jgi:hypothetical protein
MEITSQFTRDGFETWIDHLQYLDLGERHQSVPSGRSFVRGKFDQEQDAYIIEKIHIDPDMIQTDVKEELLHEAKLQAHKRDKRLLQKKRAAAMPKPKMNLMRDQPAEDRPMVTRDLQKVVWDVANLLAKSLKDPQGPTPGDARWTVSGLSHSSWAINHPDILTDGESPLALRIKKLPDGRWIALGQNRLVNLLHTKILAVKKTPPGGDDWEDIETLATTAAEYFQEQKENILSLKQSMTPQQTPGATYGGGQQQQGGGEMGGMGGGMGGMMASRRAHRKMAIAFGRVAPGNGEGKASQVNKKVQEFVSKAVNGASRLQQGLSAPGAQVSPSAAVMNINKLLEYVNGAAWTVKANLGLQDPRVQTLYRKLMAASHFLKIASTVLGRAGNQMNRQVLAEVTKNLNEFIRNGQGALDSTTTKQARRAFATLANLRKAQKIARQIDRTLEEQDWYLGVRVINDRNGIGLGIGAAEVPSRSLRASMGGIPVFLEGPGAQELRVRQAGQKHLRLAHSLVAQVAEQVAHELDVDPEAEKALKHHQRLVKRVYNHIKNSKRLSGSVRYLARKLGIDFHDLVKVIGQLIVEGKIEMTKKKKFRLLPEPHTPIPGMETKFASTNSVFGIDRGRSDKRVDQLLSQSNFQLNMNEPADATHRQRDIRERPSKLMPDPTMPN